MNVISMQPSQRLILLAIVSVSFIIVYIAFSRYVAKLSLLWLVLLLLSAKCAFFCFDVVVLGGRMGTWTVGR